MRRGGWILLFVLVLVAGIGIWWWQSSTSPQEKIAENLAPEMEVLSLRITDISDSRIKAISRIELSNPFPVEINSKSLEYEVLIDSVKVIDDVFEEPFRISSSESTVIEMPLEILAEPLKNVLQYFEQNQIDSAEYRIRTAFELDVPVAGEKEYTMDFSRRLPALYLPKVELEDIDTHILNPTEDGVDMRITVRNPNEFPIEMRHPSFRFSVEDDLQLEGGLDDYVHLPARGTEEIAIHTEITEGGLPKAGWKFLTDQEGTGFEYYFNAILGSENKILDESNVEMKVEGTLKDIADAL